MTNQTLQPASYKEATGEIQFGFTNDYMFHAVLQKNLVALKGLISSVLHLDPTTIISLTLKCKSQIKGTGKTAP